VNLFFHSDLTGAQFVLDSEESRHVKAMRHQDGDFIQITNGLGSAVTGRLTWKKHEAFIETESSHSVPQTENISLVMAPTKQHERMEWLLEKAVELGISEVYFVQCNNSERPIVRMDRLQRVVIAAIKQSQRWWMPTLHAVQKFNPLIQSPFEYTQLMAHCRNEMPRTALAQHFSEDPVRIWIGPEGDFDSSEITQAQEAGFIPISLGMARLRTETAALAAIAGMQMARTLKHANQK
jgi:16S rRNA (uracil1498-N3)-methyltransferase